jgi:hypothetical protein
MITFILPFVLPSLNVVLRQNRWKQRQPRAALAWQVKIAIGAQMPPRPIARAYVQVTRHSVRSLDPDNLAGSCKRLLDVLQPVSTRHPTGLGVIASDSPAHLRLQVISVAVHRLTDQKTTVAISDEDEDTK